MPDLDHLRRLQEGVAKWNKWYIESGQKFIGANLSGALITLREFGDLSNIDLENADLSGAQFVNVSLTGANLRRTMLAGARFIGTVLNGANLQDAYARKAYFAGCSLDGANLVKGQFSRTNLCQASLNDIKCYETSFMEADLVDSCLQRADLYRSDLRLTNFTRSDLTAANLQEITMYHTDFTGANLTAARLDHSSLVNVRMRGAVLKDCSVFGTSAWEVDLEGAMQSGLRIQPREWYEEEPFQPIFVDDLEVAQLIYLFVRNPRIRKVIDTISAKAVLILGRFTAERKEVLDKVRVRLRELGFVPIIFDFERPASRDFTETIKTMAGLSRFIIADITNPRSSPLELQATMPDYMIPLVPIIHEGEEPFAMFRDLQQKYGNWVLDVLKYDNADNLVNVLDSAVVKPALEKGHELLLRKTEEIRTRHVMDYMGPGAESLSN